MLTIFLALLYGISGTSIGAFIIYIGLYGVLALQTKQITKKTYFKNASILLLIPIIGFSLFVYLENHLNILQLK